MAQWIDAQVFALRFLQSMHSAPLDAVAVWLSQLGNYSTYIWIIAFVLWMWGPEAALSASVAALAGSLVADALKGWSNVARPIGRDGVRSLYTSSAGGTSFPSGHSLVAAAVFGTVADHVGRRVSAGRGNNDDGRGRGGTEKPRAGAGQPGVQPGVRRGVQPGLRARRGAVMWLLLALPLLIGWSRLYLGVHWPTDVMAGWIIGWTLSLLAAARVWRAAAPWALFCAVLWAAPLPVYTRPTALFVAALWAVWPFTQALERIGGRDALPRMVRLAIRWIDGDRTVRTSGWRRALVSAALLCALAGLMRAASPGWRADAWWAPLALASFTGVTGRLLGWPPRNM